MPAERSMTFCNPVKGTGKPGALSEIRWCNLCAQEIWVAESSLERENTELVCLPCGMGVMAAQPGELRMDPATYRELKQLGYNDLEIQRMMKIALARIARGEAP